MKFKDMPYARPDAEAFKAEIAALTKRLEAAETAEEQERVFDEYNRLSAHFSSLGTIASIRHTINTKDEFYDGENDFFDEQGPLVEELAQKFSSVLLASRFRPELEAHYGPLLFKNLEIAARSFTPEMIELMQQENRLQSEYQNLYASAMVEFDGKTMPLPKLGPYKESLDRGTRRAAYEAEGRFFDSNREKLDRIFDELVKNRTAQARMLGHENYIQLGYDRLSRNCYGPEQVEKFRGQIASDIVPIVARVKRRQASRLGLEKMKMYDDLVLFPDGNAKPTGTPDEILAAGLEMYHGMSPETAEFIDFMYDNELLDVLSADGKAPGGYCTDIFDYKAPFIFSNFNGTSGDVDVLTHEAGHAFASYRSMRRGYIPQMVFPTYEACECHSMSMEFLTSDYHHLFFGDATRKYEVGHCSDALIFIPYGCMVDEFQHRVYESPELTPEQRNELWLSLEKKYRPWMDVEDLPFYGRGAGWQRQLHIYLDPLYYIDYCMAQTIAFQFWMDWLDDREGTWRRYLDFADKGGMATFEQLVGEAGLRLPYDPGCMKDVGEKVSRWLEENDI